MELNVNVLESSFELVKPKANEFVKSFYDNLFKDNPEAEKLFKNADMDRQRQKLLNSLVLVVENLRTPGVLTESLKGLGARHVEYGVVPEQYPLVGGALLKTFEQYLGSAWTPEVKQAWVDAYTVISELMLEGADYSKDIIRLQAPFTNRFNFSSLPISTKILYFGFGALAGALLFYIIFKLFG